MPQVVLDAAALCGVEEWACSVEQRAETTSHSESCWHDWWCFQRPGEEQRAEGELFHGCCVDVAEQAVRLGVLPGPRQEGRKAGSPVAFAASWPFVGRYVGPSAVRPGHVGCVLRVVGQSHSTQNPNYRQAAKFKVAAVMLRPWLFDLRKELGPRQSCASAIHKFDWGGAPTKPAAEPGSGPPRQATARGSDGQCSRSCLRHSRRPCRPAKCEQSTELAAAPPRQAEARGSDGNRSRSPPRRSTMLRPPPLQSQQSQQWSHRLHWTLLPCPR